MINNLKLETLELETNYLEARGGVSTREIQREVNSAGRTFLISRVEPRAFPPSSCRFGLEDRRRERGPEFSRG